MTIILKNLKLHCIDYTWYKLCDVEIVRIIPLRTECIIVTSGYTILETTPMLSHGIMKCGNIAFAW